MENTKLYCLIYELKGIVQSLSDLADYDDSFNNPVIERIEEKTKEIIQVIEKTSA